MAGSERHKARFPRSWLRFLAAAFLAAIISEPTTMSARSARNAVNISDLRRLASKRLPRVVFDYLDGGSDDEVTLRRNCEVFNRVGFRPRHAVDVSNVDL